MELGYANIWDDIRRKYVAPGNFLLDTSAIPDFQYPIVTFRTELSEFNVSGANRDIATNDKTTAPLDSIRKAAKTNSKKTGNNRRHLKPRYGIDAITQKLAQQMQNIQDQVMAPLLTADREYEARPVKNAYRVTLTVFKKPGVPAEAGRNVTITMMFEQGDPRISQTVYYTNFRGETTSVVFEREGDISDPFSSAKQFITTRTGPGGLVVLHLIMEKRQIMSIAAIAGECDGRSSEAHFTK